MNLHPGQGPEWTVQREAEAARELLQNLAIDAGDDEGLAHDMVEGETSLIEAVQKAISEIRECEIIEAGCGVEIATLTARKDRATARKATIRAAVEQAMITSGLPSIRTPTKSLSIEHRPGKAVIVNEADIPSEFWSPQPPKLDKKALNKALAERSVPGAQLSNGSVSLTIRSR